MLLTLLGGVLWGFSGVCGQYLFLQGVSADFLVPYRLLLAGALIVLYYVFKAPKAVFAPLTDVKLLLDLLIYALLGLMMTQYAYFYSIELSNAAVATIIQYTAPVLILAIICLKERRAPRPLEILALLCAMLRVFFLATHAQISSLVISPKALFWCLISAVCVCVYSLAPTRLNARYSVALTLGTIFAFSFYITGVKLIGASKASMIACIEPLSAAFFGYFWLGTKFVFWDFLGFALIISCIFLLSKKRDDIPSTN